MNETRPRFIQLDKLRIVIAAICAVLVIGSLITQTYWLTLLAVASLGSIAANRWLAQTLFLAGTSAVAISIGLILAITDNISFGEVLAFVSFIAIAIGNYVLRRAHRAPDRRTVRWASVAFFFIGILGMIFAIYGVFSPGSITSVTSDTPITCGSIVNERSFSSTWAGINGNTYRNSCQDLRPQRISVSAYFFSLAILLFALSWNTRRWNSTPGQIESTRWRSFTFRKLVIAVSALSILSSIAFALFWTQAAISVANTHNQAFAPWVTKYRGQFDALRANNAEIDAIQSRIRNNSDDAIARTADVTNLNTACARAVQIGTELRPSVNDWPNRFGEKRDEWSNFVTQYESDAKACQPAVQKDPTTVSSNFVKSIAALNAIRPTIDYR